MSSRDHFSGVSNCYVFKSRLQEYAQKAGIPTPVYETVKEGPSHEPSFRSTVIVNNVRFDSLPGFFNRKAAEQSAAEIAFMEILKSGSMSEYISHPVDLKMRRMIDGVCELDALYYLEDVAEKSNQVENIEENKTSPAEVAPPSSSSSLEDTASWDIDLPITLKGHETGLCKNLLQEYAQKMNYAIPAYTTVKQATTGKLPFSCTVEIGGIQYIGAAARTKKEAEIKAARTALLAIQSSTGKSGGKQEGGYAYTVLPCKKKARELETRSEAAKPLKPKRAGFKKKWSKRRFHRIKGDRSKTNQSQHENANGEDSLAGPEKYLEVLKAIVTSQEGQIGSSEDKRNVQGGINIQDSRDGQSKSKNKEFLVSHEGFDSNQNGAIPNMETASDAHGTNKKILDTTASNVSEDGKAEAPNNQNICKDITLVPGENTVSDDAGTDLIISSSSMVAPETGEGMEIHSHPIEVEERNCRKPQSEPMELERAKQEEGCENKFSANYHESSGFECVKQDSIHVSALLSKSSSVVDAGENSPDIGYDEQVVLQEPAGPSAPASVRDAKVGSSEIGYVKEVVWQVPVGTSEWFPVGDAGVSSSGTGYVKQVEEMQILSEPSQPIEVEDATMSLSNCCHESF